MSVLQAAITVRIQRLMSFFVVRCCMHITLVELKAFSVYMLADFLLFKSVYSLIFFDSHKVTLYLFADALNAINW